MLSIPRSQNLKGVTFLASKAAASSYSTSTQQLLSDTGASIPVFCGPMFPGSNPELVAAVSKSGGIGMVQPLSLTHLYKQDFRKGLQLIKELSGGRPFGVNFTILPNERYKKMMDEWMHVSVEEGVKLFLTSLGKPDDIVKMAHKHNIKVYHDVHNITLAQRAADAGVDGLNLLNTAMGGQTGSISAQQFIDDIKKTNIKIPLLCAGGVGDEKAFVKALDMGYAGVQMGTRFIATPECQVTNSYKNAIVAAKATDIVLTNKLAGTESSVIRSEDILKGGLRTNAFISFLLRQPATKGYARMFLLQKTAKQYQRVTHDENCKIWQAGKGVEDIHAVEPVADVMKRFGDHAVSHYRK
jgi:nitronate monooxygenase